MQEQTLILMTRVPIPGETKTRLMPHFSAEQCSDFHVACLKDLIQVKRQLNIPMRIFYSGVLVDKFTSLFPRETCFIPQEGKDLGERMAHAFKSTLQGNQSVIMIGSDLPQLPVGILVSAFEALGQSDVVLGPARDGGYYLIGLKGFEAELFSEITWGSKKVLGQTLDKIQRIGLKVTLLETMQDLDTIADIEEFMANSENQGLQAWHYIQKVGGLA